MRSFLFAPGDSERKITKAMASEADAVIFDLEDSVAPANKPLARELMRDTINADRGKKPLLYIRVNPLNSPEIDADLAALDGLGPDGLVQPKAECGTDVAELSRRCGGQLPILAIVTETARAMFGLGSYGEAGEALQAMTWGAEDLSSDIGALTNKTAAGVLASPYLLARNLTLFGARAAGVEPIDGVYVNFRDKEGLEAECAEAVRDGFTGKAAIHPDQVPIINRVFTPSEAQIQEARAIIDAFSKAGDAGVVAIGGAMYDIPHLTRAKRLLSRAAGLS